MYIGRTAVYFSDDSSDVVFFLLPFFPVLQFDDEHSAAVSLSAQHAVSGYVGVAHDLRYVFDAGFHFGHGLDGL